MVSLLLFWRGCFEYIYKNYAALVFYVPPAYPITRNAILYWNNLCLCWNEIALSLLTGCALIRERASLQWNHFSKSVSGRSCNSNLLRKVLRGEIIFGRIWSVLQEQHNKTRERFFSHISLLCPRKSAFSRNNHNNTFSYCIYRDGSFRKWRMEIANYVFQIAIGPIKLVFV